MNRPLKILHCPLNNGNNYWVLSRAERELGLQSDLAVLNVHPFFQNADELLGVNSVTFPNEFKRINFLLKALKTYDIFHFNFGQTIWDHPFPLFNYLDLSLIKKRGKKIVFTYQGDDARQKDVFAKKYGKNAYGDGRYNLTDKYFDFNKRLRIKKMAKYADAIFSHNPDIMHVLPEKTQFLPYPNVDANAVTHNSNLKSKTIKIVHAPTDRQIKGTQAFLNAYKKLSLKYPLELILVENMSHNEAIRFYDKADIAVDQLKIGWYGGFAVELMTRGVPVISFVRESDSRQFVPFWNKMPVVNATEESVENALEVLIKDSTLRKKIGQQSSEFVQKYHHPLKIAQITKKTYEDISGM